MHSAHRLTQAPKFFYADHSSAYDLLKKTNQIAEKTEEINSYLPQTPVVIFAYKPKNKSDSYEIFVPSLDLCFGSHYFSDKTYFHYQTRAHNKPHSREWSILPSTASKLEDYFSLMRNPINTKDKFLNQLIKNYEFSLSLEFREQGIPIKPAKTIKEVVNYETSSEDET